MVEKTSHRTQSSSQRVIDTIRAVDPARTPSRAERFEEENLRNSRISATMSKVLDQQMFIFSTNTLVKKSERSWCSTPISALSGRREKKRMDQLTFPSGSAPAAMTNAGSTAVLASSPATNATAASTRTTPLSSILELSTRCATRPFMVKFDQNAVDRGVDDGSTPNLKTGDSESAPVTVIVRPAPPRGGSVVPAAGRV